MSTTYPGTLPRPQRNGYGYAVAPAATATMRDRPATRCRPMGRAAVATATLVWQFTTAQLRTFAAWWRTDLAGGSTPAVIALPNGFDDVAQPVRFLGPYQAEDLDGKWRITAAVELLSPPLLPADELAGILTLSPTIFPLPASALHYLVHTTIPSRILP
jgi:hypothetical protein